MTSSTGVSRSFSMVEIKFVTSEVRTFPPVFSKRLHWVWSSLSTSSVLRTNASTLIPWLLRCLPVAKARAPQRPLPTRMSTRGGKLWFFLLFNRVDPPRIFFVIKRERWEAAISAIIPASMPKVSVVKRSISMSWTGVHCGTTLLVSLLTSLKLRKNRGDAVSRRLTTGRIEGWGLLLVAVGAAPIRSHLSPLELSNTISSLSYFSFLILLWSTNRSRGLVVSPRWKSSNADFLSNMAKLASKSKSAPSDTPLPQAGLILSFLDLILGVLDRVLSVLLATLAALFANVRTAGSENTTASSRGWSYYSSFSTFLVEVEASLNRGFGWWWHWWFVPCLPVSRECAPCQYHQWYRRNASHHATIGLLCSVETLSLWWGNRRCEFWVVGTGSRTLSS